MATTTATQAAIPSPDLSGNWWNPTGGNWMQTNARYNPDTAVGNESNRVWSQGGQYYDAPGGNVVNLWDSPLVNLGRSDPEDPSSVVGNPANALSKYAGPYGGLWAQAQQQIKGLPDFDKIANWDDPKWGPLRGALDKNLGDNAQRLLDSEKGPFGSSFLGEAGNGIFSIATDPGILMTLGPLLGPALGFGGAAGDISTGAKIATTLGTLGQGTGNQWLKLASNLGGVFNFGSNLFSGGDAGIPFGPTPSGGNLMDPTPFGPLPSGGNLESGDPFGPTWNGGNLDFSGLQGGLISPEEQMSFLQGTPDFAGGGGDSGFAMPFGGNSFSGDFGFSSPLADFQNLASPGITTPGAGGIPGGSAGGIQDYLKKLAKLMMPGGLASNLLNVGSGAYGLMRANAMGGQTAEAARTADPYSASRADALQRIQALQANPDVTGLPGYKAGLQAVNRGLAASGYIGSGNQQVALQQYGGKMYNDEMSRLIAISNQGDPGTAGKILATGNSAAESLRGNAINRIIYGAAGFFS